MGAAAIIAEASRRNSCLSSVAARRRASSAGWLRRIALVMASHDGRHAAKQLLPSRAGPLALGVIARHAWRPSRRSVLIERLWRHGTMKATQGVAIPIHMANRRVVLENARSSRGLMALAITLADKFDDREPRPAKCAASFDGSVLSPMKHS